MSDINFAGYIDDTGKRFVGDFQSEGHVGPPGYTPQKGTDYFTSEDVEEIKDLVKTETGCEVEMTLDETTYILTVKLISSDGTILNTDTVDLPLEAMIVNGTYDSSTKEIVLTLQNGSVIRVPIGDVISGLQEEITEGNKLSSDLVDDTGNTNRFMKSISADTTMYGLSAGIYQTIGTITLKYANTRTFQSKNGILIISEYNKTKSFVEASDGALHTGVIDISTGYCKTSDLTEKLINNISAYVKDSLDYSTSGTDYALSAYQGYLLNQNKQDKLTAGSNINISGSTIAVSGIENGAEVNIIEEVQVDGTPLVVTNKAVNIVGMAELQQKYKELEDQIPQATVTTINGTANVQDSSNLPLANVEILGNATQADTPTPSTPQDIHVVTGDNTVKVTGKNLFNPTTNSTSGGGITGSTISGNSTIILDGTATMTSAHTVSGNFTLLAGTYTIKCYGINANGSDRFLLVNAADNSNVVTGIYNETAKTFTITETMTLKVSIVYTNGTAYSNRTVNVQIELGSTATDYVAYQGEQSKLIPLEDIQLCKIGDYKDRIFKAEVGNEFYDSLTNEQKATLTLGKWYVYKAIGEHTLPAKDSISTTTINGVSTKYAAYANSNAPMRVVGSSKSNEFLSDRNAFITDTDTTFTTYPAYRIAQNIVIVGPPNDTLENFNATVVGTKVKYVLETPTITEITDTALITALEATLNASTFRNTTNFAITPTGTNATGDLEITYRQDLATLISNLNNAILSLGNNV